jgi:hypothetical protein
MAAKRRVAESRIIPESGFGMIEKGIEKCC